MIAGIFLFFYTMNLWFWGSITILVAFIGASYAIVASGGNEAHLKQMEARIRKLEEAQKTMEGKGSKEKEREAAA
jgi:hypothetical protein